MTKKISKENLRRPAIKDTKTPSILKFFKRKDSRYRRMVANDLHNRKPESSTIGISWRPDKDGAGALFDHAAISMITEGSTRVLAGEGEHLSNLSHAYNSLVYNIPRPIGSLDHNWSGMAQNHDTQNDMGLLILPGVSSVEFKKTAYTHRKEREFELIRTARLKGMPILAICGGAWVLYEAFGGKIVSVTDHNYRGGMPRLSEKSPKVQSNKMLHRIELTAMGYSLRAALGVGINNTPHLPVNSVHSLAVCAKKIPEHLTISAWSLADDALAPINPHSASKDVMRPERAIEAFETIYGAPVIAVQWHPEAFTGNYQQPEASYQRQLIQWMHKAGQTYLARQKVNAEIISAPPKLKKTNLFKTNYHVLIQSRGNCFFLQNSQYHTEGRVIYHKDELERDKLNIFKYTHEKGKKPSCQP